MDFGKTIGDSFEYAKEGLVGKWVNWLLLIISCIIFPLILGYIVRIFRGSQKAPELNEWGSMFIDGIKLFIVVLIYAIPLIIVAFVVFGIAIFTGIFSLTDLGQGNPAAIMGLIMTSIFGAIILAILSIIIGLILATAIVRFARMDSFGEAFNFTAISNHIGKIGIWSYIIALIIMFIIIWVIEIILMMIPYIGWVLLLILYPAFALFEARYLTLLYDSAGAA
jgi:hypothetical protein